MADVTVTVTDQNAAAIEGLPVRIYDEDNTELLYSMLTDAAGEVDFTVAEGLYYIRFYPLTPQTTITSPQTLRVVDPNPNAFDVEAYVTPQPESVYPNMCTVSGYFVDASGQPQPGVLLEVNSRWLPATLYQPTRGYFAKPFRQISDANGYFQFDLPREAEFDINLAGYEDALCTVEVPDAASVDVADLLFPQATALTFDPAGPLALAVGDHEDINPQLLLSSGITLDEDTDRTPQEFLTFESSDEDVATIGWSGGTLVITATGTGSASITATVDEGAFSARLPEVTFTVTPLVVNVA